MEFDPAGYGQLAVFVGVVAMFLKYLQSQRVAQDKLEVARMATLVTIGERCHSHSTQREDRILDVLDRVSRRGELLGTVLRETNVMNGRVLQTLDRIDAQLGLSPAALDKATAMVLLLDKRMTVLEGSGWVRPSDVA